jgi:electron transfer flavoprotein beta subunit
VWSAADLGLGEETVGLKGSYTQVIKVFSPQRAKERVMIEGSVQEQAARLYELLKQQGVPGL